MLSAHYGDNIYNEWSENKGQDTAILIALYPQK